MWSKGAEAIAAIEKRKHHHSGLDLLVKAMAELENPQDKLKSIHVAGTNGKGSTVDFIRSMLNEAGYKVGTFTSPYLISHHDRIRIDNVSIEEGALLSYINETEALWRKYELSMFEIDMMIASLYFKEEQVDVAIFEVGMGGRLDATNILKKPLISVITNIGMDHMQYLGNTYEKIAAEKAGIIKNHTDCISGEIKEECLKVFEMVCQNHHSSLIRRDAIEHIAVDKTLVFDYRGIHCELNTQAAYQSYNAALAAETILYLREKGYVKIDNQQIKAGLFHAKWLGRFEIMSEDPLVIIDGAHNPDGIKALVHSMRIYKNIHILFSCLADKQGDEMLAELFKLSDDITLCEFDYYRAGKVDLLAESFNVKIEKDYQKAIDEGMKKDGTLLICGSLYFISLVRRYLNESVEKTAHTY